MVGALADWFAVTALFRHPLGLPIPHTAIIPHRKDQIGASLGQFVETNFLTRELLDERLERARVGARLGEWLAHPANSERASAALADALRGVVDVLDDAAISGTVGQHGRAAAAGDLGRAARRQGDRHRHRARASPAAARQRPHGPRRGFLDDNRESFREPPRQGVAVVGPRADRQPHLRQDLHRRAELPRRRAGRARARGAGVDRRADRVVRRPAARRPGADREGRGGQGGAARPPRRAGVDRRRCGAS